MQSLFYNLPSNTPLLENVKHFQTPTLLEISGIWPKTSAITLLLPLFLFYFILMALLPSHLSLRLNISLKLLLITSSWMILSLFFPSPPPSDYFMPLIELLCNDVFHALARLIIREVYGCTSILAPCLAKLFQVCLSTSTFSSC